MKLQKLNWVWSDLSSRFFVVSYNFSYPIPPKDLKLTYTWWHKLSNIFQLTQKTPKPPSLLPPKMNYMKFILSFISSLFWVMCQNFTYKVVLPPWIHIFNPSISRICIIIIERKFQNLFAVIIHFWKIFRHI